MTVQRVGIIGLGAIGANVVRIAREAYPRELDVVGALVRDLSRPPATAGPPLVGTVSDLLALCPDVVVEAAGHEGLRAHGPAVLRAGIDLITVSAGAFADPVTCDVLLRAAAEGGARIRIPSGANATRSEVSAGSRKSSAVTASVP